MNKINALPQPPSPRKNSVAAMFVLNQYRCCVQEWKTTEETTSILLSSAAAAHSGIVASWESVPGPRDRMSLMSNGLFRIKIM